MPSPPSVFLFLCFLVGLAGLVLFITYQAFCFYLEPSILI